MHVAPIVAFMLMFVPALGFAQEAARAEKPTFKGVELYSWKDPSSGTWRFSLQHGTNRNKTLIEIQDPKQAIPGVSPLLEQVSRLAEGEKVSWFQSRSIPELSYPEVQVVKEIVEFAAKRKIQVEVRQ